LPQEHPAHSTAGPGGKEHEPGNAASSGTTWERLPTTAGLTVPEKVRYWEEAVARAKNNPGGCLCRAVNDLVGLKPNYGYAGKLAKHYGRMVVWRQVKKALLDPPQGNFWAYIARALENNAAAESRSSWSSAVLQEFLEQTNKPVAMPDESPVVAPDEHQEGPPVDPAAQVWAEILDWLRPSLSATFFMTYLRDTPALGLQGNGDGQQLLVQVRSPQAKLILSERMDRQIQQAVRAVVDYPLEVVFCCDGEEIA